MLFIYIILCICFMEIVFRGVYYLRYRCKYEMIPKVPFSKMYVEPHPHLSYVYKKYFTNHNESAAGYPLHKDKNYRFVKHTTNNLGHFNSIEEDRRDVIIPKPKDLIRISCLGASTTGNYIFYDGQDYSYPLELEKILQREVLKTKIEVNNFGVGGWTSADILINFLLKVIDAQPDFIILYCPYNDLGPSLTPGFQSDYSHARKNFAERYMFYRWGSFFPYIPLAFYNWAVNRFFSQNARHSLISAVSKGDVDYSLNFAGFSSYRRNLEHIINVCSAQKIKVVLSTACFYLYDAIKNDPMHNKLQQGMLKENEVIQGLADKYKLPLVDNYNLIPSEEKYFVDTVHFTPEGMKMLAQNFSNQIMKILRERSAA